MRTQDQLTELIHALTASEKKYFKQFISMRGNSKNYERLFDEMLKQKEYDADILSKKLRKSKKQIADDKNYLQDVLLKALRNYDESATAENRLMNAYLEVQTLNRRGMSAMALRLLDKIYPEVIEHELHGLYIAMFFCKLELSYKEGLVFAPGSVPRPEFEEQLSLLRELYDYIGLYHDISTYVMRRSDPKEADNYLKSPLLLKKINAVRSYKAKGIYLGIQNSLHTLLKGLGGKGLAYAEELVSMYEKDEQMRNVQGAGLPYAYLRVALSSTFQESGRALAALQKARLVLEKSAHLFHPNVGRKIEEMVLRQQMVILNGIQDYAQCEKVGRGLLDIEIDGEHDGRLMIVFYLYAHSLAMTGKATEANKMLHNIFTMSFNQRVDIKLHARMLQLIIQIEFGNYTLLPSMIKSTRGWIKKNKLQGEDTEYVLKWMAKLSKEPASDKRKAMMISMLVEIKADAGTLNEIYGNTVNLAYWIEKALSASRFTL